jgi:hypothetical protein
MPKYFLKIPGDWMNAETVRVLINQDKSGRYVLEYLQILLYLIPNKGAFNYNTNAIAELSEQSGVDKISVKTIINTLIKEVPWKIYDKNNCLHFYEANEQSLAECDSASRVRKHRTHKKTLQCNNANSRCNKINTLQDLKRYNVTSNIYNIKDNNSISLYYKTEEKKRGYMKEKGILEKETELALFFVEQIRVNMPKFKEPNILAWSKQIDKIHRIDGYDYEEIRSMILFAQKHYFWWRNILSPDKLRKQWDRLEAEQIKTPAKAHHLLNKIDEKEEKEIKKQFIEG